ncbi:MAG: hypothetical protein EOQ28_33095 [Mesorhizobium sp.]|uniref:hypothetical protein n=1 Tax=Mesorhizobium sp. TaxID=1871066 RepID=UPI000FE5B55A|nr:hypothetical protein [Mesorhizobium sp.]RWA59295.1 MAG: hypothetical protein EOQ28_33095 [Mesorhizobium sp.]
MNARQSKRTIEIIAWTLTGHLRWKPVRREPKPFFGAPDTSLRLHTAGSADNVAVIQWGWSRKRPAKVAGSISVAENAQDVVNARRPKVRSGFGKPTCIKSKT